MVVTLRAMTKTYRPYVPEQDLLLPPKMVENSTKESRMPARHTMSTMRRPSTQACVSRHCGPTSGSSQTQR